MRLRHLVGTGLFLGLLLFPVLQPPAPVLAGELVGGYWPNDPTDEQLKKADNKLLELQRRRFKALFGKDESEVKRLNKEFSELQRERRRLLRASGRQ